MGLMRAILAQHMGVALPAVARHLKSTAE